MTDDGRYKETRRPLLLLGDLMTGKRHDRDSIAERLGVGKAAADKLIIALLEYLPSAVSESKENRKRTIRFEVEKLLPNMNNAAVIATCFGASVAELFEGTDYPASMKVVLDFVIKRSKKHKLFLDTERKFFFNKQGGEFSLPENADVLKCVIDSIIRCRILSLEYKTQTAEMEKIVIKPLSLVLHQNHLYVVGYYADSEKTKPYLYRLSRIKKSTQTEDEFSYPTKAQYDPKQVFSSSLGLHIGGFGEAQDVEIRFNAKLRAHFEHHRYHISQKILKAEETGINIGMHVPICPELEGWVLSFADNAEVVKPIALRDKISKRLSEASNVYKLH